MKNLAVFGTASNVGKSVLATALCRIFSDSGIDVAPFKAQNMSNNSGVTPDGLEIGRAQIAQAEAARVVPTADMNPVLLKPNTDIGSQVVVHGRVVDNCSARDYFGDTKTWSAKAFESLHRLQSQHEMLVIEGAGSCAEMNLYDRDFVNFKTAREASAPVVLVADIDRGGVFAQVVGTMTVIPPEDRARVAGVIVNRFRGDASLFTEGIRILEKLSGIPVLGVVPFYRGISIEEEDAVPLQHVVDPLCRPDPAKISIAVLYLPHISNFTDFAVLEHHAHVEVHYLQQVKNLEGYQAVILPGSKNVRGDLDWLCGNGWESRIKTFHQKGGMVAGICGGYQMLGKFVDDPCGHEGEPGRTNGLGLLPVETVLQNDKTLCNASGRIYGTDIPVRGYEIHMGETGVAGNVLPLLDVTSRNSHAVTGHDGAVSSDGNVLGTYFHGIFDGYEFRQWFLQKLDPLKAVDESIPDKEKNYELLAEHVKGHLDMDAVYGIVNG